MQVHALSLRRTVQFASEPRPFTMLVRGSHVRHSVTITIKSGITASALDPANLSQKL